MGNTNTQPMPIGSTLHSPDSPDENERISSPLDSRIDNLFINVQERAQERGPYAYPPPLGRRYFLEHFQLGTKRFTSQYFQSYLFGDNSDLYFIPGESHSVPFSPSEQNLPIPTVHCPINLHKDSIKLLKLDDKGCESTYLIEFEFDAELACNITVLFSIPDNIKTVQTSKSNSLLNEFCSMSYLYQAGFKQRFTQRDYQIVLGTLDAEKLIYDNDVGVYPIVIKITTQVGAPNWRLPKSIIHCTILSLHQENNNYMPHILKQTVTYDGLTFLLQEIYGLSKLNEFDCVSTSTNASENSLNLDPGEECIVCMSAARDTLILPCRHLSICSTCAESLKSQSRKCPICRTSFEALLKTNTFYHPDGALQFPEPVANNILAQQGYYPISLFKSIYNTIPPDPPIQRPPHIFANNHPLVSNERQLPVTPYPVNTLLIEANDRDGVFFNQRTIAS